MSNILESLIEVTLPSEDNFLKVRETLTRIGIASKKEQKLYQSCHILHKQGKYYVVHFKELFALDGKPTNITESDLARRSTIANLLAQWKLVDIVDTNKLGVLAPMSQIKILSHGEKAGWELIPKYNIGKSRKPATTLDVS